MLAKDLIKKTAQIRLDALSAIEKSGYDTLGLSMSVVEILVSLYYGDLGNRPVLDFDVSKPGKDDRDHIIMSKTAGTVVLYSILADLGFFDKEELNYFAQVNSKLKGRPYNRVPGVSATVLTPSHGLSMAVGMALTLFAEKKRNKVFSIMDFNELQNGQVWEAAIFAAHQNLNNLILMVDDCGFQFSGTNKAVMDVSYLQAKFDSFGWQVIQVRDGHDFDQILDAIERGYNSLRRPVLIWCHTLSAKGIDFAEGKLGYVNATLSKQELDEISLKIKKNL